MSDVHEILVPVDFSDASARALDTAIGLARAFRARLHLLHCYPVQPLPRHLDVPMPVGLDRDLRRAGQQRVCEWGEKVSAAGVSVAEHLSPVAPAQAIAECASDLGADWIVMGTRGLTEFRHALLGSVVAHTLPLAPCPVLTVGPGPG